MIQRSYRTLLIQLSNAFCKNTIKQNKPTNPKSSLKIFSKKKPQQQEIQATGQQKNKQNKEKRQRKQAKQNKDETSSKQSASVNWATIELNKDKLRKLEELNKGKAEFQNLYKTNNLEADLSKDISGINAQFHTINFVNRFLLYIRKDPHRAINFFQSQALLAKPLSEQAIDSMNKVKQEIVKYYLETQNLEGLNHFFILLQNYYKQNKGCLDYDDNAILSDIQMISQFPNTPIKYRTLANFFKVTKISTNKTEVSKKCESVVKKILQQFIVSNKMQGKQVFKSVQQLIEVLIDNKLFPSKFIKSPSFYRLLRQVYYHKSNLKQTEARFFKLIGSIKTSFISQNDFTESYFMRFYKSLMESRLESTNCERTPIKITAQLIEAYERMFQSKNKQGVLAILAICLINRYLSIPEHFLKHHQKGFSPHFPDPLINLIKEECNLLQLDEYVKKGNDETESSKLEKILMSSQKFRTKLKVSIITKDYQTAMSIYHKQIFESQCIEKEKQITRNVLLHIVYEENQMGLTQKQQSQIRNVVNGYVQSLSSQYLLESWKKREDVGYLLEDFYIREGESQQKTEKRFSFYDTYFEIKRAREINKFEKLNELNIIKEPNQHPFVQNQFNLNEYLKPDSYKRYREVADYDDYKQNELLLYFTKVQASLLQLNQSYDDKEAAKVLSYQQNMCEQNLKLLEEFGLKDYDVIVHDFKQFQNRLAELKRYRGVKRLSDTYNQLFIPSPEQAIKKELQLKQSFTPLKTSQAEIVQQIEEKTQEGQIVLQSVVQIDEVDVSQKEQIKQTKPKQKKKFKAKEENEDENNQQVEEAAELKDEVGIEGQDAETLQGVQTVKQTAEQVGLQSIHISTTDPSSYFKMHDQIEQILNNSQFLDLVRVRRRQLFSHYSAVIKLPPQPFVENLILWGLIFRQPMAIYMGEKLAMMTGQLVPHHLAIRVSDMFSQFRQVDEDLFIQCKKCLSYIGKIEREFIYDSNKSYQHIISKNIVENSIINFDAGLRQRLQALAGVAYDLKSHNNEPSEILKRASKGPAF